MAQPPDLYALMGLPRDATAEEIRQAYHAAARRFHPDANPGRGKTDQFIRIQEAYEILCNPERRLKYDRQLQLSGGEGPVLFTAQFSRQQIPALNEEQVLYALLSFSPHPSAPVEADRPAPAINLCLALDRSTSMQGERMDTVKAAAIEAARQLKPDDFLAVVVFGDRAEVIYPSSKQASRQDLETRIRMIRTGGGTELRHGLEAGLMEVRRHLRSDRANHLIVLTDGRTYGDEAACLSLAERAAAEKICISCLGIGEEWNDLFMDELTARTGGSSHYVNRVDHLGKLLQEKFKQVSGGYAEGASLCLQPSLGVAVNYVFRVKPEPMPLSFTSDMRLGSIPKRQSLSVMLELVLPPLGRDRRGRFHCASGELSFTIPTKADSATRLNFDLTRPISQAQDLQADPPPAEVRFAVSQVTLYRMQERARREALEGDCERASQTLQNLATHLLARGERELAHTALMEAGLLRSNRAFSESGEKQVKYGTRALLLPSPAERNMR